MTKKQAIEILENANKWRRCADINQPDPTEFGKAIDFAINELKK